MEKECSLLIEIKKILAFFDLFEYPLTAYEIWEYLDKRPPLEEIVKTLENQDKISQKNGFYFLAGREEIITTRQKRHNYTLAKIKIARRFSRLFRIWPFIKMIAVSNIIGQHNLRAESDIDFFIITAPGRIWLTRLFCAGLAKILNRRPTAKNKQDKICLSFYISTNHLNLNDLKLPEADPYFDYWLRGLVLLYNKKRTYEQFLIANGLKAIKSETTETLEITTPSKNQFLNILENSAKRLQLKIMPAALKAEINRGRGVVIAESVLKLYLIDRRQEFLDKYEKKVRQLI